MTRFGELVTVYQTAAGLSVAALATRLGYTRPYIAALVAGRKPVPPVTVSRLANVFELTPEQAEELHAVAASSVPSVRFNLVGTPEHVRKTVQALYNSVEENNLSPDRAREIMKIINA